MGNEPIINNLYKIDGWNNVLSGLGRRSDKTQATQYGTAVILNDDRLTQLWLGDGVGARVVNTPSKDMTRNWFEVTNDPSGLINKEMTRLQAESIVLQAIQWARLYRGSIIIMGIDDGGELDQPVKKTYSGMSWLKSFPASQINLTSTDIVQDPTSKYYMDVEWYPVTPSYGTPFKVHASRCLVFKGIPVPSVSGIDFKYRYWGVSALQPVYDSLRNLGSSMQGVANIVQEFLIGKYTFDNLPEILAENNTDKFYNRMEVINACKSLINAVMLGPGESYTRDAANVTGLPDLLDRMMMMVSAASAIPVTKLFGRSPAGQNATGESDMRNYYDDIASLQDTWLLYPMQRFVNAINVYVKVAKDAFVNFLPVWTPSEKELIEMRSKQAETDKIYIETGVLDADEVREQRFVGGYSFETGLDKDTE